MKKSLLIILVCTIGLLKAQIPTGYYDGTAGLTGAALKTKLSSIITNGHQDRGYDNLYVGYTTTDVDRYYENDGSVLDAYSENPSGADPYNFQHVSGDRCGNYSKEGDCYNREHTIPQSFFGSARPMVSDIHHIPPTDGKVNGMRSNYPFGVVNSPSWTSRNGSKVGSNSVPGYTGTVFEPINEFKGDIARMIFYFVTRYESRLKDFSTGGILGGSAYPGLQTWELNLLLSWHNADPVSQREIDRNNAAYKFQGNRNPYIDNPNWVADVWGGTTSTDTTPPSTPTNLAVTTATSSSVSLSWTASTDNVAVSVYEIYLNSIFQFTVTGTTATVLGLAPSTTYNFNVVARDYSGNVSQQSNTVAGTTTAGTGGGTSTVCGTENFESIPANSQDYLDRTWTSNGITWTATEARTDQTLNGRAITIENGTLSSSTISGGISSLTVTTQMKFTGNPGTFNLYINGEMVGQIPYSTNITTTTIPNINVAGDFIISITDNSAIGKGTRGRVAFDDLSWTCYTTLGTGEQAAKPKKLMVSPNPVKNSLINISGLEENNVKVEIYNAAGQLLQTADKVSKNSNKVQLRNLGKGVYILKAGNQSVKFIVE